MGKWLKQNWILLFAVAAGILGGLLRAWQFSQADEEGLIDGTVQSLLLALLSALVLAAVAWKVYPLTGRKKYASNFPPSVPGALGCVLAAIGVLTSLGSGPLSIFISIFAAVDLCLLAYYRATGRKPSLLLPGGLCIYLMLRLVICYQLWCSEPQMAQYLFSLMGSVFVLLSAYYDAAFCAGAPHRRPHALCHLLALFCCLTAAGYTDSPLWYLGFAVWAATDICSLARVRKVTK
ncbi:MAG: hypothetical protein LUH51_05675 [Firmicutes bacterium]|nr:hypothetical protein [Bacillota bacterium]